MKNFYFLLLYVKNIMYICSVFAADWLEAKPRLTVPEGAYKWTKVATHHGRLQTTVI